MPILNGKKCLLRPIERSDMPKFLSWRQDRGLRLNVLGYCFPVTAEMDSEWFDGTVKDQSRTTVYFSIVDVRSRPIAGGEDSSMNAAVGYCRLVGIDWVSRVAELGVVIGDTESRGQRIGIEAIALICRYGFDDLNLNRIHLHVRSDNAPAIRIYTHLGFQNEGLLRSHYYGDGAYHNVQCFGMLRDERAVLNRFLA